MSRKRHGVDIVNEFVLYTIAASLGERFNGWKRPGSHLLESIWAAVNDYLVTFMFMVRRWVAAKVSCQRLHTTLL